MITYEELKVRAEKYVKGKLTAEEHDTVLSLLNKTYVQGFMQGYTCAGGVLSQDEATNAAKGSE